MSSLPECSQRMGQMPETDINFQKEEGEMLKEIKINSKITIKQLQCSQASELQRQKWHPAQTLRGSGEPSHQAFAKLERRRQLRSSGGDMIPTGDDAQSTLGLPRDEA